MGDDRMRVDYETLDRLLVALGEGVSDRVTSRVQSVPRALTVSQAVRAALLEPANPNLDTTLPRGVPLDVALRAALRHFLPGATAIVLPAFAITLLLNPFERGTAIPALGILLTSTAGFGAALVGLRRWLFPHANPDGHWSDVAGMAVPFVVVAVGIGMALRPVMAVAFAAGSIAAVITSAPWLKPTQRVGRPSPPHRWSKLRATALTGVGGAIVFSAATVLQGAFLMALGSFPPPGMTLLEVLPIVMWQGGSTGFVVGLVFALLLAALYARVAVDRLRAWRVGLLGALGGVVPYWTWVSLRAMSSSTPIFEDPLATIARISLTWAAPGFLLAYASVKVAQRSAKGGG